FEYKNAGEVFAEIREAWNPKTGYDLRGISYNKLRRQSCQWPCAPDEQNGKAIRYLNPDSEKDSAGPKIIFPTESGKAQFFARPFLPPAELPDAEFPFVLTTGRVAHQWHTLTKTGKISTLNKLNPGAFVEIHPEDAGPLKVADGALVRVGSRRGFAVYPAQISDRVRPGDCFAPIHWNDQFGENLCVNAATNDACDAVSLQPEFKFSAVALAKVEVDELADFTPEQKQFLHGLMVGMSHHYQVNGHGALILPKSA